MRAKKKGRKPEREAKAASASPSRRAPGEGEAAVLAAIAAMPEPDRTMAERLHILIQAHAPMLSPRLWYGMPAYAKDGKVVCFFQGQHKFKTRYATFGFTDAAYLDEGHMWPVAFALKALTPVEEAQIIALLQRAVREPM